MKFITPIFLIQNEKVQGDYGDSIVDPTKTIERKVYCNKLSISQKEFYEAKANGTKPEIKFEIREFEYMDENVLRYNDVLYDVVRNFNNTKRGTFELVCSKSIMKVI